MGSGAGYSVMRFYYINSFFLNPSFGLLSIVIDSVNIAVEENPQLSVTLCWRGFAIRTSALRLKTITLIIK